MAKMYHPEVNDPKMELRKAIQSIRKKTKIDKSKIVEKLIRAGLEQAKTLFQEE